MFAISPAPELDPVERPHSVLLTLHWLMAALFAVAVLSILTRGALPSGHALRPVLRSTHLQCGQLILLLAFVRVAVRWRHPLPATPGVPRWASHAGHAAHLALYGVMLLQPLSGIVFMQAGDKAVSFLGWTLPTLVASDKAVNAQFKDLHLLLGNVFYGLLALHVTAALWHHYGLKNHTLTRMLGLRSRQPPSVQPTARPGPEAWPMPLPRPGTTRPQARTEAKPEHEAEHKAAAQRHEEIH